MKTALEEYGGGRSPQLEHTQLWRIQTGFRPEDIRVTDAERAVLRELARQVAAQGIGMLPMNAGLMPVPST